MNPNLKDIPVRKAWMFWEMKSLPYVKILEGTEYKPSPDDLEEKYYMERN
jgi:hypothetical protein